MAVWKISQGRDFGVKVFTKQLPALKKKRNDCAKSKVHCFFLAISRASASWGWWEEEGLLVTLCLSYVLRYATPLSRPFVCTVHMAVIGFHLSLRFRLTVLLLLLPLLLSVTSGEQLQLLSGDFLRVHMCASTFLGVPAAFFFFKRWIRDGVEIPGAEIDSTWKEKKC